MNFGAEPQSHSIAVENGWGLRHGTRQLNNAQIERIRRLSRRLGRLIDDDLRNQRPETVIWPEWNDAIPSDHLMPPDKLLWLISMLKDEGYRCEGVAELSAALPLCHALWIFECIPDPAICGHFEDLRRVFLGNTPSQDGVGGNHLGQMDDPGLPDSWVIVALVFGWDEILQSACKSAIFDSVQATSAHTPFEEILALEATRRSAMRKTIQLITNVLSKQLLHEKDEKVKAKIIEMMSETGIDLSAESDSGEEDEERWISTRIQEGQSPKDVLQAVKDKFGECAVEEDRRNKNSFKSGGPKRASLAGVVTDLGSALISLSTKSQLRRDITDRGCEIVPKLEQRWNRLTEKTSRSYSDNLLLQRDHLWEVWFPGSRTAQTRLRVAAGIGHRGSSSLDTTPPGSSRHTNGSPQ